MRAACLSLSARGPGLAEQALTPPHPHGSSPNRATAHSRAGRRLGEELELVLKSLAGIWRGWDSHL